MSLLFTYLFIYFLARKTSKKLPRKKIFAGLNGQDWVPYPFTQSLASRKEYSAISTHPGSLPGIVGQGQLLLRNM